MENQSLIFKIFSIIAFCAWTSFLYNALKRKNPSDIKNHIYSTIPVGIWLVWYLLLTIFSCK